jgi:hypothetical protein
MTMLDTVEAPTELPLVEQPTKRELVEEELRTNSNRSDREIGRICGVDHKTVSAARVRLGIATPLAANSPPTSHGSQRRQQKNLNSILSTKTARISW